ncbi:hypothetical protein HG536_0B06160 [Torulaspora globosa]|uniref:Uncharacterized protein n=1 Tax=Torulaspora globosa TaxID=48254 RepID=A0A7G3ZE14_9SACH|nr:uncharacterized protein HG536_0B06160 [Torulaspora globosa]QLL31750.1 hypothetical protein HG536_0B06160 [Torulaspora globosa]
MWFTQGLERGLPVIGMIMVAFEHPDEQEDGYEIMLQLTKYSYEGEMDPSVYLAKVEGALCLQMDQGSEFANKTIKFFREKGIVTDYTTVGDSRSDVVAERAKLLLLNDCRTLLDSANLSEDLLFYAVKFATMISNSVVSSSIGDLPRYKPVLTGLDADTILPSARRSSSTSRTWTVSCMTGV